MNTRAWLLGRRPARGRLRGRLRAPPATLVAPHRGSGDLGLIIERASGSLGVVDTSSRRRWAPSKAWATCRTPRWCSRATARAPTCSAATAR
jgi:hypothetical protein